MERRGFLLSIIFTITIFLFMGAEILWAKHGAKVGENKILKQKTNKRVYLNSEVKALKTIEFDSFDNVVGDPWIAHVNSGKLYIYDGKLTALHEFDLKNNFRQRMMKFPLGKGPGDLTEPRDFKIYKDTLYFADVSKLTIELFSLEGKHLRQIKLSNHEMPRKITVTDKNIISSNNNQEKGKMFSFADKNGVVKSLFGFHVINEEEYLNTVYFQSDLSCSFNSNKFYNVPLYLGIVSLYENDKLLWSKETIDGINYKTKPVTILGGAGHKVENRYYSAARHAIFNDFILIQAIDIEKNIRYLDFYTLKDFNYLGTIKNAPRCLAFVFFENKMICIDEMTMTILDVSKVSKELMNKKIK